MVGHVRTLPLLAALAVLGPAGTAHGAFTQELGSPFLVGSSPFGATAADLNGDGRPDLAVPDAYAGKLNVYLRQPGGGFAPEGAPLPALDATDVAVGDFDNDLRPDLATSNYPAGTATVLLRNPANTGYTVETGSPYVAPGANSIAVARVNGDAFDDLVLGGYSTDAVKVLYRNSAGTGFLAPVTLQSTGHKRDVVTGDFDGNGRTDIAATNEPGSVDVWLQNGGGGFPAAPSSIVPAGGQTSGIEAADFSGDGRLDLAVALVSTDRVAVLRGQADGSFVAEPGSPYGVGDGPRNVTSADFDSDGRPDIAAGNFAAGSVTVLLRAGDGFVPDPSSPLLTGLADASGIDAADFDRDGRADLAFTSLADRRITIAMNTTPRPPGPPPPSSDADADGVQRPLDCRDDDAAIRPGIPDRPGDGVDQDCSGADADYPLLVRRIRHAYRTSAAGFTQFTKLQVIPVRAGDRVRLRCKGQGCPLSRRVLRVKKDRPALSVLPALDRAKLRKGAVLELRVTRRATIGVLTRWKIRAPKDLTTRSRCLRPGAGRPVACP